MTLYTEIQFYLHSFGRPSIVLYFSFTTFLVLWIAFPKILKLLSFLFFVSFTVRYILYRNFISPSFLPLNFFKGRVKAKLISFMEVAYSTNLLYQTLIVCYKKCIDPLSFVVPLAFHLHY